MCVQVDSELRAEESSSQAVSDATHTGSVSVGTNTLQVCLSSYFCHCEGRKVCQDCCMKSACIAALHCSITEPDSGMYIF